MTYAIVVAYAKDNLDKTTIAFTLAKAALEGGHQVRLVLTSEGVRVTVKGFADDMNNGPPFLPLKELIALVQARGAEINVCTPCMAKRGLEQKDMIDGVSFIDGAGFVRIVSETERSIQL
jgi:predicted peroxiredoxin